MQRSLYIETRYGTPGSPFFEYALKHFHFAELVIPASKAPLLVILELYKAGAYPARYYRAATINAI